MTKGKLLAVGALRWSQVFLLVGGISFLQSCSDRAPAFQAEVQKKILVAQDPGEADATTGAPQAQCLTDGKVGGECGQGTPDTSSEANGTDFDGKVNPGNEVPGDGSTVVQPPVVVTPVPTPVVTQGPSMGRLREVTIVEPEQGKVDILWVIDSSGSMEWAQRELSSKFENFANELLDAGVDFNLGVTSLDVCRPDKVADEFCPDSRMFGSTALRGSLAKVSGTSLKILSQNTPQFVDKFKSLALLGTSASGLEQGLSAAKFAVEKSASGGVNAGFIRSDAQLSVIVLSDEEDDGIGMWEEDAWGNTGNKDYFGNISYPLNSSYNTKFNFANQHMTAERFVSEMNGLKGAGKFQVNAITGIKKADGSTYCYKDANGTPFGPVEAGTNYQKASGLTGGVVEDICGNWASILSNLGRSTVELTTRISLPSEPFAGTLEVYVNGTLWASGYEYEKVSRSVVFKTNPPFGAEVVVRYREIF